MGPKKEYTSFAHEIASLKRKEQREKDDTSTIESGTCCAACGLECSIVPAERITCQKCQSIHYCGPQCLKWHWESGGHSAECPGKPSPQRMEFLKFQQISDEQSTVSGTCCNACGLACYVVGEERTVCPECEEVHYCNADCQKWDWTKGGHSQVCSRNKRAPPRRTTSGFQQVLNQTLQQQRPPPAPPTQQLTPQPHQFSPLPSNAPPQHDSIGSASFETVSEYTEETVTDSDAPLSRASTKSSGSNNNNSDKSGSSGSGSAESRDDDGDQQHFFNQEPSEHFLDDIPEGSQETTTSTEGDSADMETLQINMYGSAMAAHDAPYQHQRYRSGVFNSPNSSAHRRRHSTDTPDTPETPVTSNMQYQQPERYTNLDGYLQQMPAVPEPSPTRGFLSNALEQYRRVENSDGSSSSEPEQYGWAQRVSPARGRTRRNNNNVYPDFVGGVEPEQPSPSPSRPQQQQHPNSNPSPAFFESTAPQAPRRGRASPMAGTPQRNNPKTTYPNYYFNDEEMQDPPTPVFQDEEPQQHGAAQPTRRWDPAPTFQQYYSEQQQQAEPMQSPFPSQQQNNTDPPNQQYYHGQEPQQLLRQPSDPRLMQQEQQHQLSRQRSNPGLMRQQEQQLSRQRSNPGLMRQQEQQQQLSRQRSNPGLMRSRESSRPPFASPPPQNPQFQDGLFRQNSAQSLQQNRGYAAPPEAAPAMFVSATPVPVRSSGRLNQDMEIASSSGYDNPTGRQNDGYEQISTLSNKKHRSKGTVAFAVIVSFTIGILVVVATVGAFVWYNQDIAPTSRSTDSAPTPAPGDLSPLSMASEQEFLSASTGFGASVAIVDSMLAIGSDTGEVETYTRSNDGWVPLQKLTKAANTGFGVSMAMNTDIGGDLYMVVGAPSTDTAGGGAAHIFSHSTSPSKWEELGISVGGISGSERRLAGSELFGTSVALSSTWRVVVGAPEYNQGAGRVFIYHLNKGGSSELTLGQTHTLSGGTQNAGFGNAVDISDNGVSVVVGEPGQQRFRIYEWNGSKWSQSYQLQYPQDVDLGSSVSFLSHNYLAVGAPSAQGNKGMVRVCQRSGSSWEEVGTLVGDWGDSLGAFGTIGGTEGPNGPQLVLTSANGVVQRFDLVQGQWVKRFEVDQAAPATSVAVSVDGDRYEVLVGIGGSNAATLFTEQESGPSMPSGSTKVPTSTPAPIRRPTTAPNTAPTATAAPVAQPTTAAPNAAPTTSTPAPVKAPSETPAPNAPPTAAPTLAPVGTSQPTAAPTASPTAAPTPEPEWVLVGSPLTSPNSLDGFGKSVALAGDFLAASEPLALDEKGQTRAYQKNVQNQWNELSPVSDANAELFGSAVDLAVVSGTPSLLVGAENTRDVQFSAKFGSASYYEWDGTNWVQLGSNMEPAGSMFESGGEFGGAVAMSQTSRRVAIGAPSSSLDGNNVDTGRVYTFEYASSDWQTMTPEALSSSPGSLFGSSLSMSQDGSRLLVGAPGAGNGKGAIFYYEWNQAESTWKSILSLPAVQQEGLGWSVSVLDTAGDLLAFGGPTYGDNGQGLIRVYKNFGIAWFNQGSDIVGQPNERIGTTVCGAQGRVAFGTDTGAFHVYEYDGNDWVEVAEGPSLGSPVVSIAMSEDATTVAVGLANEEVRVYELS